MTVKLSVSLPDDVAVYLASEPNTSAIVAEAVRRYRDDEQVRRRRRREQVDAYATWLSANPVVQKELDDIAELSNTQTLSGHEW